jgi:hypothetical protein
MKYDIDDLIDHEHHRISYHQELLKRLLALKMLLEKPAGDGWVPFGTHANNDPCTFNGELDFSPPGEDGLPNWERHQHFPKHCRALREKSEAKPASEIVAERLRDIDNIEATRDQADLSLADVKMKREPDGYVSRDFGDGIGEHEKVTITTTLFVKPGASFQPDIITQQYGVRPDVIDGVTVVSYDYRNLRVTQ